MPRRNVVFATDQIYHIFNRSVGREMIFPSLLHLRRIFELVSYYRFPQTLRYSQFKLLNSTAKSTYLFSMNNKPSLVEIYTFAFMPNHYHFLLKQTHDNGIRQFIANIQNSYAKYFNLRHDRTGTLFQNSFQGKWIETDEQFMHVTRYIHLNPVTSFIISFDRLDSYPFTSFADYTSNRKTSWLNKKILHEMFGSQNKYQSFVADQVDYQRTLAGLKDVLID